MATLHTQPQTPRPNRKRDAENETCETDILSFTTSCHIILGFLYLIMGLTSGAIEVSSGNIYGWILIVFVGGFGMYEIIFTLACMFHHRDKVSRANLNAAATNLVISFLFAGMQAVYAVVLDKLDYIFVVIPGVLSGFLSAIVCIKICISFHCNNPKQRTFQRVVYFENDSDSAAEETDLLPPYSGRENSHFSNELEAAELADLPPPYPGQQTVHFTNESGTAEVTDLPPPYPGRKFVVRSPPKRLDQSSSKLNPHTG